jgi:hypothetical protein
MLLIQRLKVADRTDHRFDLWICGSEIKGSWFVGICFSLVFDPRAFEISVSFACVLLSTSDHTRNVSRNVFYQLRVSVSCLNMTLISITAYVLHFVNTKMFVIATNNVIVPPPPLRFVRQHKEPQNLPVNQSIKFYFTACKESNFLGGFPFLRRVDHTP